MSTTSQAATGTNLPTQQSHPHPCPSCGHCPTCGKSNRGPQPWGPQPWPYGRFYPNWYYPYWSVVPPNGYGTITTSSTLSSQSGLSQHQNINANNSV